MIWQLGSKRNTWLTALVALGVVMASGLMGLSGLKGYWILLFFLALLFGAGGLVFLLKQPALGLVAMAALSPILPLEMGTGSEIALTPPMLLIPAVVLVWALEGWRKRSLHLSASRTTLPLLLFVGSGLLSLLAGTIYWDPFVPRPGNLMLVQLAQWSVFALSAAVFLFAGDLGRDTRWLRYATWAFLILAGVVMLEAYIPSLHSALGWNTPERAKSSIFLVLIAALTTGQLLFNRRLGRLARLGLFLLWAETAYVVWFMWNEWTSGLGPFSVATLAVVWLWFRRRSRAATIIVTLGLIALAIVVYPFLFELSGGERELEYSWGGRLVLYQAVLSLVENHPILGLGPAAYRHYGYARPLSEGYGRAFYVRPQINSHNNYIDIYAQMGLVGLGLFLWFLVELGLLGWRLSSRFHGNFEDGYVQGAIGALAGSLVAMMLVDWFLPFIYNVGFPGFRTSSLAWMFLGGLVALEQTSVSEKVKVDIADA
jgi:O-antigen ligase